MVEKAFYESAKDWCLATNNKRRFKQIYTKLLFPEDLEPFKANPIDRPFWSDDAYVAVIKKGHIFGKNGAVIAPDGKLVWDVSLEWFKSPEAHSFFQKEQLPLPTYTKENIGVLTHQAPLNYYHWMYEVLPRIHLIQKSGMKVDRFVINGMDHSFQFDTIKAIGIEEENIIRTNLNFHLQAKKLIVPSLPNFATKWAFDFLKEKLEPLGDEYLEGYKRIYIQRRKFRKVLNESEIIEILSRYGFKVVLLESLPVARQISIFQSAEVVIGPHGAGLTNLTFSKPGTKIIELTPSSYISSLYFLISSFGKLDYHCLVGKAIEHPNPNKTRAKYNNIYIDPEKLQYILDRAGIKN